MPTFPPLRYALVVAAIGLPLLLNGGCASNPATGGPNLVLMSEKEEIKTGRKLHEEQFAQQAYDDPELTAYIDRIGQNLVAQSHRPDLPFTFTVINSPQINAFALPGGYIYINRGLLAYLKDESELAGVLGHEIAHVTARHSVRQKTAATSSSAITGILAVASAVATGSGALGRTVADSSAYAGTALVRGYGREHELEADRLGAEYMHKAGYSTDALLRVIGVLKDQEQYARVRAKESGQQRTGSYHGLFSTHPRNDDRLKEVIKAATELGPRGDGPDDPNEFRDRMQGLPFGDFVQGDRDPGRFYHNRLGFSFERGNDWNVDTGSRAIVAKTNNDDRRLTLTLARAEPDKAPAQFLQEQFSTDNLRDQRPLTTEGLSGYTGLATTPQGERRVAVINRGNMAFLFAGEASNLVDADAELLSMIESFRPILPSEQDRGRPLEIRYVRAVEGMTYADLARNVRLPDAEGQLRLLNGHYPRGEPEPGNYIKVIRAP